MGRDKRRGQQPTAHLAGEKLLYEQAWAFANSAAKMGSLIRTKRADGRDLGCMTAFLTMAGLSVELYIKAFMLVARSGVVSKGHSLEQLYEDLPEDHRARLEHCYLRQIQGMKPVYEIVWFQMSFEMPTTPPPEEKRLEFQTLPQAVKSLANAFVDQRYFFEKIRPKQAMQIHFPYEQVLALLNTFEEIFVRWRRGDFSASQGPESSPVDGQELDKNAH